MLLGKISPELFVIDAIILVALLWIIIGRLVTYIRGRNAAILVDNNQLKKVIHKVQVIDVRENNLFKSGHILGARNIPFTQFKMSIDSIRKDIPVYLYDQGKALSIRAAILLKKNGFNKIYVLKGGYGKWNGKKKADKYK